MLVAMDAIALEGVRVHNLDNLQLSLPLHCLVVITGVSGSGKSSLAFDTLAVEGQRRYIETLSPRSRQFLDRLQRPAADRIDNIPPTVAIRQSGQRTGARETVATATEVYDYLRLLFARAGRVRCPDCKTPVTPSTASSIAALLDRLPQDTRFQVAFAASRYEPDPTLLVERLGEDGFRRALVPGSTTDRSSTSLEALGKHPQAGSVWIVLDRLKAGQVERRRLEESLEQVLRAGDGQCLVVSSTAIDSLASPVVIDSEPCWVRTFFSGTTCDGCERRLTSPEPRLFSFHSPLGACQTCRGFGSVPTISFQKLVPDPSKTLREGAIVAWTTPAYVHELDELLALADDYDLPVDIPFDQLDSRHLDLIVEGVRERDFGGLRGFFAWLERHRYKLPVRVFLNRWRAYDTCPDCDGQRLQPDALAVHLGLTDEPPPGPTIAGLCRLTVDELQSTISGISADVSEDIERILLAPLRSRLDYLRHVGLGYLTLDRPLRTLSGGESRRVALTQALGSDLVNTLYILDEPTAGLHVRDIQWVIQVVRELVARGNSAIVVEHDRSFIEAADEVVDIGPGAGREGGRLVFQGPPAALAECRDSPTGRWIAGVSAEVAARTTTPGESADQLTLTGASRHNLKNISVTIPLGQLVVVTGVSGSGKSSLVEETLYPAACHHLGQPYELDGEAAWESIEGLATVDQVLLVDPKPIGQTPRSVPVTYLKAFDAIRRVFAETPLARQRGYTARQFSFNATGGGRCDRCGGSGSIEVDMQFLADIRTVCPECRGTRFGRETLDVTYRGRHIADVLSMSVAEAFTYFRGEDRLRRRLQFLRDVGLDYLPLGQPATTLSGGESQRLKLASFLSGGSQRRTLFLLNEPTTGLHAADVGRLLLCLDNLLAVGHSLVVVEHHLDVIRAADHVIDLGPEAGDRGGELVATGTPEEITACAASITGQWLKRAEG